MTGLTARHVTRVWGPNEDGDFAARCSCGWVYGFDDDFHGAGWGTKYDVALREADLHRARATLRYMSRPTD